MITGVRVRLRAIESNDLSRYVEWLNDPEVMAGVGRSLPLGIDEEEAWFREIQKREPIERSLAIDALRDTTWRHIGGCGLFDFDHQAHRASSGIMIGDKSYWDQGYGTDAMLLLLEHAFMTLNLNRVDLHVFEHNQRALKVYNKIGFIEEGRLRDYGYRNGEYFDTLIMSILRAEWLEGKRSASQDG
jgi:RimJ/RimL family protein N-acetyltransferase